MTRLRAIWESLRASYWFVPTLMAALSAVLAFVMVRIDYATRQAWIEEVGWFYGGGVNGAREVLSTIASSMITVAGVVFSITIVALTLASSQFGPRLLRNFMRDLGNQIVLGTFISTYLFCVLVLRSVGRADDFVPHVSVTTAVVLSTCSLGVLIYFIHHAAASIQAPQVVARVSSELNDAIDSIFPDMIGQGESPDNLETEHAATRPADLEQNSAPVLSASDGYIQAVDTDALLKLAASHDVIVQILSRPGHFIAADQHLARVYPKEKATRELSGKINEVMVVNDQRTLTQDVEFAIDQLVEIAVRALSPGVNDPFTAINCIDRIWQSLSRLCERRIPSPHRLDEHGRLRVIAYPVRCDRVIAAAFNQIRQYGRTSVSVTIRLLEVIAFIAPHVRRASDRIELARQADMILAQARQAIPEEQDRKDIEQRHRAAIDALQRGACP